MKKTQFPRRGPELICCPGNRSGAPAYKMCIWNNRFILHRNKSLFSFTRGLNSQPFGLRVRLSNQAMTSPYKKEKKKATYK